VPINVFEIKFEALGPSGLASLFPASDKAALLLISAASVHKPGKNQIEHIASTVPPMPDIAQRRSRMPAGEE